jgi:sugar/nucleoside kinase (ribokinase family)
MKTALDPNWDPDGWTKERIEEIYGLLKVTDWFFPDIDEAREISFTDREMLAITKLLMFGPKTVCLKMGERGCLLGTKESIKLVKPFNVKPINTTGAGDVFLAGFIKSYLSGKPLEDVVMFSNAAAALSIAESGLERYPTHRKVVEFMKKVRI